jgi:hypothetical protein
MKRVARTLEITKMSSQETWFATTMTGPLQCGGGPWMRVSTERMRRS